ncbi:MAG: glycosyltransferase [bacterium]
MASESKIRLLHVVSGIALAGTEYNVIKLVNRLDRSRFLPAIAGLQVAPAGAREHVADDVETFELAKGHGFQLKLILQLAEIFRRQRIDIVHSHNWTTFLYAVLAARLAAVPVILHGEHGRDTEQYEHNWKRSWLRKYLASCCDQLTAVSTDIAELLRHTWGVPEGKISLIPNGVMLDKFKLVRDRGPAKRALGIATHVPTIGAVIGYIRPVKDLPNLFRAFALVRQKVPEAQLLVVGHAPDLQQFEDLASDLAIAGAVHFLGKRSDIHDVMPAFDVYVNSSIYEGMSNTILEAMASGVPVVATAVGGTPAIVSDGMNGALVPPKSPELMSETIAHLLENENKRKAMTQAGRLYIERHHSFQETLRQYEVLYLELAHQKLHSFRLRQPKQFLKASWGNTWYNLGALKWRGKIGQRPLYIINYHRVLHAHVLPHYLFTAMAVTVRAFTKQMEFFRQQCRVLSLTEALQILANDLPIPERAIVLTFDDGYRELYTVVRPILEKYRLPVTVFLPSGLIGTDTQLWFDAVGQRLQTADLQELTLRDDLPEEAVASLRFLRNLPRDRRQASARTAVKKISELHPDLRKAVVDEVMKLQPIPNDAPDNALLDWDMIREMQSTGLFAFGSHSITHPRLDLLPEKDLDEEIGLSQQVLEVGLNHPVEFFSYPWGCYNDLVIKKVRQFGYRCAVALTDAPNYSKAGLFALKRLDAGFLTLNDSFHKGTMVAELTGLNRFWRAFLR